MELTQGGNPQKAIRKATEKYEPSVVKQVSEFLFRECDVYVPSDKFGLWVVPPLIVSEDELDFLMTALERGLEYAESLIGSV